MSESVWIPVSERLPDPTENVLVTSIAARPGEMTCGYWSERHGWTLDTTYAFDGEVTHWMPLPAPPPAVAKPPQIEIDGN